MASIDWSIITDGAVLAVVGMFVVFAALLFLYLFLSLLSRIINRQKKEELVKRGSGEEEAAKALQMSGETSAAIAMALHLYFEDIHDQENTTLTIKRLSKTYSPWSSKIYSVIGLNKGFSRKAG